MGAKSSSGSEVSTNENGPRVYYLHWDPGGFYREYATYLDGDIDKVKPEGVEFPEWAGISSIDDGWAVSPSPRMQGIKVETEHLPTKICWPEKKSKFPDMLDDRTFIVNEKIKRIIENIDPVEHQFVPVDVYRKDNSYYEKYYWLYPLTRIDSVNKNKTTLEWDRTSWRFEGNEDGRKILVFSKSKIGSHNIWVDKHIYHGRPYISEKLKVEFEKAGISGVGFRPHSLAD